jgi:hypothetical protein
MRPLGNRGSPVQVGEVRADGRGQFTTQIEIPAGQGWEGLPAAIVAARAVDASYRAEATFHILPALHVMKFDVIPTTAERFALAQPTYLAIGSQAAWEAQFGKEPPPASPPVDWQREIVLAAFLGPQAPDVTVNVQTIVQREGTVSVWLTAIVPDKSIDQSASTANLPRVMVRVARSEFVRPRQGDVASFVFAFLDATGRVLAQGPAGSIQPPSTAPAAEAQGLQAPFAEDTAQAQGAAPSPTGTAQVRAVPEAPAAAVETVTPEPSTTAAAAMALPPTAVPEPGVTVAAAEVPSAVASETPLAAAPEPGVTVAVAAAPPATATAEAQASAVPAGEATSPTGRAGDLWAIGGLAVMGLSVLALLAVAAVTILRRR